MPITGILSISVPYERLPKPEQCDREKVMLRMNAAAVQLCGRKYRLQCAWGCLAGDFSTGSSGFKVLEEVDDRLGTHLNQTSLLKIKELIRRPERELMDRQNGLEAFMGMERFLSGVPQEEFRKLASGEKRHKL